MGAALCDPSVDPRGRFAVSHALGGPRRLSVRESGHLDGAVAEAAEARIRRHAAESLAVADIGTIPELR
ncbi:hypothetical protein N8K70_12390 [Microbacterium betulae]|uniref:Uncharacterized protein n=1 Tax=Microbacterium betulae TaxID=2981139 RepID=A0AA97FES6_9MICO|nr:hypothetical protein [Microbacterium sp. AB]WOF22176.1 hypothetical protein N8K70_12390 [Microbacterium sp. AB]